MAVSDAQKRASSNYRKRNVKQVVVSFYPADKDLYEYLQTKESKQRYIRDLIREDMNGYDKEQPC